MGQRQPKQFGEQTFDCPNCRPTSGQFGNNQPSDLISNTNQEVLCFGIGCPSNNGNSKIVSQQPLFGRPGNHQPAAGISSSGTAFSDAFPNQSFNGPVGEVNHCTNKDKCFSNNGGSTFGTNTNRPQSVAGGQQQPSTGQSGNNQPSAVISNTNQEVLCFGIGCPSNNGNGQISSQRPLSGQLGNNQPSVGTSSTGTAFSDAFANQSFNGPVGEVNHCTNKNKCFANNGGSTSGTNTNRPQPVTGGQQQPSMGQSGNNQPSTDQQLTGTKYVYRVNDFHKKSFQDMIIFFMST